MSKYESTIKQLTEKQINCTLCNKTVLLEYNKIYKCFCNKTSCIVNEDELYLTINHSNDSFDYISMFIKRNYNKVETKFYKLGKLLCLCDKIIYNCTLNKLKMQIISKNLLG